MGNGWHAPVGRNQIDRRELIKVVTPGFPNSIEIVVTAPGEVPNVVQSQFATSDLTVAHLRDIACPRALVRWFKACPPEKQDCKRQNAARDCRDHSSTPEHDLQDYAK